ncbi:MAG: hypothetical protein V1871_04740 [Planctomycetota bacterium]
MKKKILIALGVIAFIILLFIGIEYIQFLKATKRMEELSRDLEQRITEWEKKEYKRPPLFGPAIAGNAAEYYQQAESQMTALMRNTDVEIDWSDYINRFEPLTSKALFGYEKAKPIIELVKQGNKMELYKSPLNIRDGFECKMPNILSARNIANAMVIQGRELEKNNQYPEALQLYCEIIRFGDSYFHYGTLIPAMISIGASEIGYEEIRRILLTNKLSEDDLNKLISYLKILFNPEPFYENVWDTERLLTEAWLIRYAKTTGFLPTLNYLLPAKFRSFGWTIKMLIKYPWVNRTTFINASKDVKTIYPEVKRIDNLPYAQAKQEAEKFQTRTKALKNPISRDVFYCTPSSGKTDYLRHQSQRRGLYILCALEIYKASHQKYPEKLSDLAPDLPAEASAQAGIIPNVPLDPFSDQPFIYKIQPDDTIMLYSVGENLKDDGGDEKRYNDIVIAPLKKQ